LQQNLIYDPPDVILDLVGRPRCIDDADTAGFLLRQLKITVPHTVMERKLFVLEPRFPVEALARVPAPRAPDACRGVDVEKHGEPGTELRGHDAVQFAYRGDRKSPAIPLVGERGIGEPVAQDDPSRIERGG
jgi:hypothetical protein